MKKIHNLYNKHRNLVLYGIIGSSGALLDYIAFIVLYNFVGLDPMLATTISISLGIINNFILNALFNFKTKSHLLSRFASFYAIGILGILLSIALIYLLHHQLGIDANIAKLISIPIVVIMQYILNKHFTFGGLGVKTGEFVHNNILRKLPIVPALFSKMTVPLYALPVALLAFYIMYMVFTSGLGYDDSYNLQVSQNLADNGIYATNGAVHDSHPRLFDYYISTGPTLLVPTAIAIKLFGNTLFAPKLISFLCLGLFIFLLYKTLRTVADKKHASHTVVLCATLFATALILVAGNTENILVSTVGEVLSIALLLLSWLLLSKGRFAYAGLVLGLAVLTKILVAIALPFTFVALLLIYQKSLLIRMKRALIFISTFAVPFVIFEVYRFASFGYNLQAYKFNVKEQLVFFRSGGSGIEDGSVTPLSLIVSRFEHFTHASPLFNNPLSVILIVITLAALTYVVFRHLRQIQLPGDIRNTYSSLLLKLCGVTGLAWIAWWFLVTDHNFIRHSFGAITLLVIFITGLLLRDARLLSRQRGALTASFYIIGGLLLLVNIFTHDFQFERSFTQPRSAAIVRDFYADKKLYHFGWWQNPEVQYLSNLPSTQYIPGIQSEETIWVLRGSLHRDYAFENYQQAGALCDKLINLTPRYQACEIRKK